MSAFRVAELLGMQVHLDRHIEPRGFTNPKGKRIWVRGDRGTRMEHACAHEIGHHHVYDQDRGELLERACNRFAAALMLPAGDFAASVRELGLDPPALARVWRWSSLEAIGRRIAEVVPGASAAAWLELEPKWREGGCPSALARLELQALGEAYCRARGVSVAEGRAGVVRVWRTGTGPRSAVSVLQAA